MDALLASIDWRQAASFGLVLARLSGALLGAPLLGQSQVPLQVKAVLLLLASTALYPGVRGTLGEPPSDAAAFALLVGRELGLGLALGFAIRLAFAAEELAGQVIATQLGLTMASIVHPDSEQSSPALVNLLHAVAVLIFLAFDGHHLVFRAVHESFALAPPSLSASLGDVAKGLLLYAGKTFLLAVQISAPVVAAALVANVGMGIVARAAPSLNVFSLSFGVTILVGLAVLTLAAPGIVASIAAAFRGLAAELVSIAGGAR